MFHFTVIRSSARKCALVKSPWRRPCELKSGCWVDKMDAVEAGKPHDDNFRATVGNLLLIM